MKLQHFAASLAFAASALAATPGSFAPVTIQLTITQPGPTSTRTVANGATESTFTITKTSVTNVAILLEAQRVGLIPAGSLTGWYIVLANDADYPRWIYARNRTTGAAVRLESILDFTMRALASRGKHVRPAGGGKLTSGNLASTMAGDLYLAINGIEFDAMAGFTQTETVKPAGITSVWLPTTRPSLGVVGYAEGTRVLTGKISSDVAGKVEADMLTLFPDFDTFPE